MLARVVALSLALTAAACQGSGRYGTPSHAGAVAGVAAAGAAASRALGGCLAECRPGYHCNAATGVCDRGEALESRPLGAMDDAGCAPPAAAHGDGGAIFCEMDGGTI